MLLSWSSCQVAGILFLHHDLHLIVAGILLLHHDHDLHLIFAGIPHLHHHHDPLHIVASILLWHHDHDLLVKLLEIFFSSWTWSYSNRVSKSYIWIQFELFSVSRHRPVVPTVQEPCMTRVMRNIKAGTSTLLWWIQTHNRFGNFYFNMYIVQYVQHTE